MQIPFAILCFSNVILICSAVRFETPRKGRLVSSNSLSKDGSTNNSITANDFILLPERSRKAREVREGSNQVRELKIPLDEWICDGFSDYCFYNSSETKGWLEAFESCSAIGGMLPFWLGDTDAAIFNETRWQSWSSLFWHHGRWHEFKQDTYSFAYLSHLTVSEAVLRYVVQKKLCFAVSTPNWYNGSEGLLRSPHSNLSIRGYDCNSKLPFVCISYQQLFNRTQESLTLPLRPVKDIRIEKAADSSSPTQGEILRCVAEFDKRHSISEYRPFSIIWILDDAYYPNEGMRNDSFSTVLRVPFQHFTKYSCEVRYLGSIYGNRSQEIEISDPSVAKLGLAVRTPNDAARLDHSTELEKVRRAFGEDPLLNLTIREVGVRLYEPTDRELVSVAYFELKLKARDWREKRDYERIISIINSLWYASFNRPPDIRQETQIAIQYFRIGSSNGTIAGVQLFFVDQCPVEDIQTYIWYGSAGKQIQARSLELREAQGFGVCYSEYNYPVTRTCGASLVTGAQWVEPFDAQKNCSNPSSKQPLECPTGFSLVLEDVPDRVPFCAMVVEANVLDETMNACFRRRLLQLFSLSPEQQGGQAHSSAEWITKTEVFISQSSGARLLSDELLWLPLRRRVPGGVFYPYLMQQYNENNPFEFRTWLADPFDFAKATGLSVLDLEFSKLCLAWSVRNKTLSTRDCAERHPVVCIRAAVSKETWPKSPPREDSSGRLHPEDFYVPSCRGFDLLVRDEYNVDSCYKSIAPHASNETSFSVFTWEEAAEQCKVEHPEAFLAVPKSEILRALPQIFETFEPTWLGIRQSLPKWNSSCRLVTVRNKCANIHYTFTDDTDFSHGVYVSATEEMTRNPAVQEYALETFRLNLRLPGTKLRRAICQVELHHLIGDESPVTYHLKLSWDSSSGDGVKVSLIEEGQKTHGFDWERFRYENCRFAFSRLLCFGDGNLIPHQNERDSICEIGIKYPADVTSLHCESMTRDAKLLRSNTLPWRHSHRTFVLSVWNTSVSSTSDAVANYSKNVFRSATNRIFPNGGTNTLPDLFSFPFDWRHYAKLNEKYGVYHLTLMDDEETPINAVYKQLWEELKRDSKALHPVRINWLRNMVVCFENVTEGSFGNLTWLETPLGVTTYSQGGCIPSESHALIQRTCIGDIYSGAHWGPLQVKNKQGNLEDVPVNFTCAKLSQTTTSLLKLSRADLDSSTVLANLSRITNEWDPIMADVQLSSTVFFDASRQGKDFNQTDVDNTATIFENILQVNTGTLAKAQKMSNISTQLLFGLEEVLTNTHENRSSLSSHKLRGEATLLDESSSVLFLGDSTSLGKRLDMVNFTKIVPDSNYSSTCVSEYDAVVSLTTKLPITPQEKAPRIAFIYHTTVRLAVAAVALHKETATIYSPSSDNGDEEKRRNSKYVASSAMVQVGITAGDTSSLEFPVNIFLRPFFTADAQAPNDSHVCVFWNSKVNNGNGGWSTSGCWQQGYVDGLIHCQCNHLSAFTVLFAYEEKYESTVHDAILDMLTMVGCGLSLMGCIGVIATYSIFSKWRKPKPGFYFHHVLFHMSLALGLLLSFFLGGFEQTNNRWACLCVAAGIHYFTLVTFSWMLVEAYCHYSLFIKVWGRHSSKFMLKASLLAWLLPLAPVIVGLVLHDELYSYTDYNPYCWLKPKGFFYLLLPFASFVAVMNTSLYVLIVVKLGCVKVTLGNTQRQSNFTFHTAVATFILMGMSWIFGLLAIGQARIFFSYLFCICNSMQGFAFFVFFILRGNLARQQWQNALERTNECEQARRQLLVNARPAATLGSSSGNESSQTTSHPSRSAASCEQVLLELRTRNKKAQ